VVKYYKEVTVTGSANEETLENILTSTETEKYKVNKIWFTEVTSTLNGDATLRVYLEREKILDMSYKHLLKYSGSHERLENYAIDLDLEIPVGQTLAVGHVSGSTASDFKIAIQYEIIA